MDVVYIASVSLYFLKLCRMHRRFREKVKRFRRWWVQQHLRNSVRDRFGLHATLFSYFRCNNDEEFYKLLGMTVNQFNELHAMLQHKLQKSSCKRIPLSSELRLALTVRYFKHGDSIDSTARSFFIGRSTAYSIIDEASRIIWDVLNVKYLRNHSAQDWLKIAQTYEEKWGFPNCLGALDGKHIRIMKPPRSGSLFFNYKKYFSIVLMAICDADYRFIWTDVGDYGSLNDQSIFGATTFYDALVRGAVDLPPSRALTSGINEIIPYFFIADEAFRLSSFIMRPFSRRFATSLKQLVFNFRLSRARMTIENSFGILSGRWRILRQTLCFNLSTNMFIVQATVCLHNFLIESEMKLDLENRQYIHYSFVDRIGQNGKVIPGEWRSIVDEQDISTENEFVEEENNIVKVVSQREVLAQYFLREQGLEVD